MSPPLAPLLLQALEGAAPRYAQLSDLEARLQALVARAREGAPGLRVSAEQLLPYAAARLDPARPPGEALEALQWESVYLCCACALGDAAAFQLLEGRHFDKVAQTVARIDPSLVDELQQTLREKLFLREGDGGGAKIESYSGRGSLTGWLCAIAGRMALELRERLASPAAAADEGALAELASPAEDAEIQYLKARYREAYRDAFSAALRARSPRERAVLRLHFASGLSLERIGQLYQTHKSTISRWLAQARAQLVEDIRRELQGRLGLPPEELDSLTAQVRSQVSITLTSVWGSKGD